MSAPGPMWGTHMGKEGQCRVVGTPSAVQLHEVTALAAAPSLKSTSEICPLERTSKDRTM